jgi:hypothetical protein
MKIVVYCRDETYKFPKDCYQICFVTEPPDVPFGAFLYTPKAQRITDRNFNKISIQSEYARFKALRDCNKTFFRRLNIPQYTFEQFKN